MRLSSGRCSPLKDTSDKYSYVSSDSSPITISSGNNKRPDLEYFSVGQSGNKRTLNIPDKYLSGRYVASEYPVCTLSNTNLVCTTRRLTIQKGFETFFRKSCCY